LEWGPLRESTSGADTEQRKEEVELLNAQLAKED
jgi:hypothetical protein